jgi:very-short-patch-repair endonuclease/AraC-like DNA-binding protein
VINVKPYDFTKEEIDRIRYVYETNEISISELAKEFGLPSRSSILTTAKKMGLTKTQTRNARSGFKTEWTEEMIAQLREGYASELVTVDELANSLKMSIDTMAKKAKELGLSKVRKQFVTDQQMLIIREMAENQLSIKQIIEKTGLGKETIRKIMRSFDIPTYHTRIKDLEDKEAFFKDLGNPRYSAPDLRRKYGVSDGAIHKWRRKIYGEFKLQLHTTEHLSDLEMQMVEILEELDLAYIPQKKIDKWTVDFYLGQKTILEVDGYYHDKNKVQEKDSRKLKDLRSKGYQIITISYSEFENKEQIKLKISTSLGFPLLRSNEKNFVNASKSGVADCG